MMPLLLNGQADRPLRLLCLGAHSDDIEIGCAASILRLAASRPLDIRWIVFSANGGRRDEAENSAADLLQNVGQKKIELLGFPNAFFPDQWAAIKAEFERIKAEFAPDLILTHHKGDDHQDHRIIAQLTWNTFRDHLIWEYEIPKYDGDLGNPNIFVSVPKDLAQRKVDALMRHFKSQQDRNWFTPDAFMALMRLRGIHANSPSGLAEGFYGRKLSI